MSDSASFAVHEEKVAERLAGAAVNLRHWPMEKLLPAYRAIGFTKFETMFGWPEAHFDLATGVDHYRRLGEQHETRFTSAHLGRITADNFDATLKEAVEQARFAADLGCSVCLFKADSRETYIKAAGPFLDQLEQQGIAITPVLQNHKGSPITTLEDYRAVIDGIGDARMKTLLEVGHFARAGIGWNEGYDLLGDSIALVHLNEISEGGGSVPYGEGAVDFVGLFKRLGKDGYAGEFVVELELPTTEQHPERSLRGVAQAIEYLRTHCLEHL
jgi:sugar phosphate isomerase/epimerase